MKMAENPQVIREAMRRFATATWVAAVSLAFGSFSPPLSGFIVIFMKLFVCSATFKSLVFVKLSGLQVA
jgi:hypothetical protein